jgi:hypothetical protein
LPVFGVFGSISLQNRNRGFTRIESSDSLLLRLWSGGFDATTERRDSGGQDLFRARLDQIIDLNHELAKLARAIDWRFLEEKFGAVYTDRPGRPPLPTRLMAGLAILKHTFDLSDEVVCARWVENPYYQYFCGDSSVRLKLE